MISCNLCKFDTDNLNDYKWVKSEKIKVKRRVEKEYRDRDRRYKDERNYNDTSGRSFDP